MGKQSLIPTAGRRKGACNCLCFQACRAVGFAACILWNWFPQQPDLQGGYCKLLVARGKATQASLLLERNGNRDTPAPSSTSRTRKGLTAGRPRWGPWRGWVGGWVDGFALWSAERGAARAAGATPAIPSRRSVPGRPASRSRVPAPRGGVGRQARAILEQGNHPGERRVPGASGRAVAPKDLSAPPDPLSSRLHWRKDGVLLKLRPPTKIRISASNRLHLLSLLYRLGWAGFRDPDF